ncbi:gamma-glutamyl-gamma-aminobutyrate hydrolase family protein [Cupriavidus sp. RAF12]
MHADGLIEAIRGVDADFVIGVQWHPEVSASTDRLSQSLFMRFGDACRRYVPSRGIVERTSP